MNRIEANLFLKQKFNAIYNAGRQEWRISSGDHIYTVKLYCRTDNNTYETYLNSISMLERIVPRIGDARDDIAPTASNTVRYVSLGEYEELRMTRAQLQNWIMKTMLTNEFK